MPVVPINPGSAPGAGAALPSQTNLLMALAEMKNLGRINPSQDEPDDRLTHNVARFPKRPVTTKLSKVK